MHLNPPPPCGLGCCPLQGGGSVVVDSLFIVAPIMGVCNCSMFCCKLLYVHTGIKCGSTGGGDRGPDPSWGKSQVIWVSIGNKQLDSPPPPPPLESVGPPLEP